MAHWTAADIPWESFDLARVDPDILAVVRAASLVERNAADYATYLGNVFGDDAEFRILADEWAAEEIQHGDVLGRWAEMADASFNYADAFKRFVEGYRIPIDVEASVRGSRTGELIARCIVETGTSSFYSALRDATEEPVLKAICHCIAGDEFRHYKLFYTHMRRYQERERLGTLRRAWVAAGRFIETGDDELPFAYHCANTPDDTYHRRSAATAYAGRAYGFYRLGHLQRAVNMMLKAGRAESAGPARCLAHPRDLVVPATPDTPAGNRLIRSSRDRCSLLRGPDDAARDVPFAAVSQAADDHAMVVGGSDQRHVLAQPNRLAVNQILRKRIAAGKRVDDPPGTDILARRNDSDRRRAPKHELKAFADDEVVHRRPAIRPATHAFDSRQQVNAAILDGLGIGIGRNSDEFGDGNRRFGAIVVPVKQVAVECFPGRGLLRFFGEPLLLVGQLLRRQRWRHLLGRVLLPFDKNQRRHGTHCNQQHRDKHDDDDRHGAGLAGFSTCLVNHMNARLRSRRCRTVSQPWLGCLGRGRDMAENRSHPLKVHCAAETVKWADIKARRAPNRDALPKKSKRNDPAGVYPPAGPLLRCSDDQSENGDNERRVQKADRNLSDLSPLR